MTIFLPPGLHKKKLDYLYWSVQKNQLYVPKDEKIKKSCILHILHLQL